MEKKSTKKTKATKKATVAAAEPVDPFAETVKPAAPKRTTKTVAPVAEPSGDLPAKVAKKPRVVKKVAAAPIENDAFAELASAGTAAGDATTSKVTKEARPASKGAPQKRKAPARVKKDSEESIELEVPKRPGVRRSLKGGSPVVLEVPAAHPSSTPVSNADVAEPPLEIIDITAELAANEPEVELSPAFKALADVKLPELTRENRARLQMQSPTALYFYWSIKQDPWHQLRRVFGDAPGSYILVLKLTELNSGVEQMHPCDAEGNWWFTVEPDGRYQAEVGFYAPNRPYFRIIYSNTIDTPRNTPSPRPASEARWTVSATKFAEVLDASGFSRDAMDVAIAGDDPMSLTQATYDAFKELIGGGDVSFESIPAEDVRRSMLAIAAGDSLEQIRFEVSASLFAVLQANADKLSAASAQNSLDKHFEIDNTDWTEYESGPAVFGASVLNFPKTLKGRRVSPKTSTRYNPVSSFSIR